MPKEYKDSFLEIINSKIENNYNFILEHQTMINGKPFKYISFNIDKELLVCAVELAKEKSNYTMAQNQASVPRDWVTKVQKCAQGVLAEMFIHVLLTQRYGFEVKRYDLERETFIYSVEEYDLKIIVDGFEYEVESRSSNIHHTRIEDFILNDVIIGPYGNKCKTRDELADFHFRPIYMPEFVPFVQVNGKYYYSQNLTNGDVKLVITGVATKEDFLNYSYIASLGQRGTTYNVVNAIDIGDVDAMDFKFHNIL